MPSGNAESLILKAECVSSEETVFLTPLRPLTVVRLQPDLFSNGTPGFYHLYVGQCGIPLGSFTTHTIENMPYFVLVA